MRPELTVPGITGDVERDRSFRPVPTYLQFQTTECGVAAIAMMMAYHGQPVTMEEIRQSTGVSRDCLSAGDIVRCGREFGFDCSGHRVGLEKLQSEQTPFILHMDFIHFVVVEAVLKDRVLINDPAVGRSEISLEALDEVFTGIIIRFRKKTAAGAFPVPASNHPKVHRDGFCGLWERTRPRAKLLAGLSLIATAAEALSIIMIVWIIGGNSASGLFSSIVNASGSLFALVATILAAEAFRRYAARAIEESIIQSESEALIHGLLDRSYFYVNYRLPGDMFSVLSNVSALAGDLSSGVLTAIQTVPALTLLLAAMISINPLPALSVLSVVLIAGIVITGANLHFSRSQRNARHLKDQELASVAASLHSIEEEKVTGRNEDHIANSLGALAQRNSHSHGEYLRKTAENVAVTVAPWMVLSILVVTAMLPLSSETELFQLFLLGGTILLLLPKWKNVFEAVDIARHALFKIDDVYESAPLDQLRTSPVQTNTSGQLPSGLTLRLQDVTFGHSSTRPPLFENLSLDVSEGQQLGITGPSGGGKSSFGAVAAGLHQPWSGAILTSPATPAVVWVDKSAFLFEGSLRDNLTLWNSEIADKDIWDALNAACLDDVIQARIDGLDCLIEPRGRNFSGGQCQRMEIARAVLLKPSVIILDEALDALDPALEQKLRANLRQLGFSLIIISHRTSTLLACDQIYNLKLGRLEPLKSGIPGSENSGTPPCDIQTTRPVPSATPGPSMPDFEQAFDELNLSPSGDMSGEVPILGDPVSDIARRRRLYVRPIHLHRKTWWQQPVTPFIGLSRDSGQPEAVLPEDDHYRVTSDPDADPATVLEPKGFAVYQRDDVSDKSAWNFFCFGHASASRELIRIGAIILTYFGMVMASPFLLSFSYGTDITSLTGIPHLYATAIGLTGMLILLTTAQSVAGFRLYGRIELTVMNRLHQRLIRLSPAFIRQARMEDISRGIAAVCRVLEHLRDRMISAVCDLALAAAGILALMFISPAVGLTAGLLLVPLLIIPAITMRSCLTTSRRHYGQRLLARRFLLDLLQGIGRLRSLGYDGKAIRKWLSLNKTATDAERPVIWRMGLGILLENLFLWLTILGFGMSLFSPEIARGLSAAEQGLALGIFWLSLLAIQSVAQAINAFGPAAAFHPDFCNLLNVPLEPAGKGSPSTAPLTARDIYFTYKGAGRPALSGVSLDIEPGAIVAIAGPSGSGKSTLTKLLLGFELPDHGEICFGDTPLTELDIMSWRHRVGVVKQSDRINNASTLRSHITGYSRYQLADAERAAAWVELTDTIAAMPMGMQTILERDKFSTGQEQRLLLARQLVRQPSILILDEATNAIPEDLQKRIFANIRALGTTCILVTHRETAIQEADKVIILDQGRISWTGTPAALVEREDLTRMLALDRRIEEQT